MDYIETKAKLDYLELKNKRCQALAEFTKSLSKSQFIKYQKILKLEEKIRKKWLITNVKRKRLRKYLEM